MENDDEKWKTSSQLLNWDFNFFNIEVPKDLTTTTTTTIEVPSVSEYIDLFSKKEIKDLSPWAEGILSDIPSTSTSMEEYLESQTGTSEEVRDELNRSAKGLLREIFINKFSQLLQDSNFEFGFSTPAEEYIRDVLSLYGPFVREWINELFIQNYDNPFILSVILRVIAHFDYQQMYPQGPTMAIAAARHKDTDVRECAVRCFENWESSDSLKILRNISFSDNYLQKYLEDVIAELEALEPNAISR